jgi:hypothetical protein
VTTDINGAIAIISFDDKSVDVAGIKRIWHDTPKGEWYL